MVYAVFDNRPFSTSKELRKTTVMTKEQKERQDFIRSHSFYVVEDPSTKECIIKVEDKNRTV